MARATLLVLTISATSSAGGATAFTVPPARTYSDAVRKTCESFAIVGPIAFSWTACPLFFARQPATALRAGILSAQRWGGTSAGFSGGRAFSQVVRQSDDVYCAVAGGVAAGLLGSPSVALIPARVASFAGLSILLETQVLPRLQTTSTKVKCKPNLQQKAPVQDRGSPAPGRPLKPRPAWGSRTPWAEQPWMKAISRIDQRRQAFEDSVVEWLMVGGAPASHSS